MVMRRKVRLQNTGILQKDIYKNLRTVYCVNHKPILSIDKMALEFTPQELRRHDSIGFTHARTGQRNDVSSSPSPLSGSLDIRLCCEAASNFTSINSVYKPLLHANESSTMCQLTAHLFFLYLFAESACNALLLLPIHSSMLCSSRSLASSEIHPFASRIDDIAELTAIRGLLT